MHIESTRRPRNRKTNFSMYEVEIDPEGSLEERSVAGDDRPFRANLTGRTIHDLELCAGIEASKGFIGGNALASE
jgi:hypothetical protein